MPLETLAEIQDKLPGVLRHYQKSGTQTTAVGAGNFSSMWRIGGTPGTANQPGATLSGEILTGASVGSPFLLPVTDAIEHHHLAQLSVASGNTGVALIYDRLWQSGQLANVTTAQTINSIALPTRAGTGYGVELWLEAGSTNTTSASTTVSYTNELGVSGRSILTQNLSALTIHRNVPLNLVSGDNGVQSVQTLTFAAAPGVATNNLVLRKPICRIPVLNVNTFISFDTLSLGIPILDDETCFEVLFQNSSLNTANVPFFLEIGLVQG